jgi:hypothetical protein
MPIYNKNKSYIGGNPSTDNGYFGADPVIPTPTPTVTSTTSITPTPTVTPSNTATPSHTPSNTPTPVTQTPTPSQTPTSVTPTPTNTPTQTIPVTPTNTPSHTPRSIPVTPPAVRPIFIDPIDLEKDPIDSPILYITQTPTPTPTSTQTPTPTQTPTQTCTPTQTPTQTATCTPTKSASPTPTPTASQTGTPTQTPTQTPTGTATNTPTPTQTPSHTGTPTQTPTSTATQTPSHTAKATPTPTPTTTPSLTPTSTHTPPATPSPTPTITKTATPSLTPTKTGTNTPTPTQTPTNSKSQTDEIRAFYRFDENMYDYTCHGYDLTTDKNLYSTLPFGDNPVTYEDGPAARYNKALQFNGNYTGYCGAYDVSSVITVIMWVKIRSNEAGGNMPLYVESIATGTSSKVDIYQLALDANGWPYVKIGGIGATSAAFGGDPTGKTFTNRQIPIDGQWHNIAFVVDTTTLAATNIKIYVDRALGYSVTTNISTLKLPTISNSQTGGTLTVGSKFWFGALDEIMVYDKELPAGLIYQAINNPSGSITCITQTPTPTVTRTRTPTPTPTQPAGSFRVPHIAFGAPLAPQRPCRNAVGVAQSYPYALCYGGTFDFSIDSTGGATGDDFGWLKKTFNGPVQSATYVNVWVNLDSSKMFVGSPQFTVNKPLNGFASQNVSNLIGGHTYYIAGENDLGQRSQLYSITIPYYIYV